MKNIKLLYPILLSLLLSATAGCDSPSEKIRKYTEEKNATAIISMLDHEDTNVRAKAELSLIELGDSALKPLISGLDSTSTRIRHGVIVILGEIGDKRAVKPLITSLNNSDTEAQRLIAEALVKISDPGIEAISSALRTDNEIIKSTILKVLGDIGGEKAIRPLIVALKDSNPKVRNSAAEALVIIGEPATEFLIESMQVNQTMRSISGIVFTTSHSLRQTRCLAAKILGEIGDQRAIKPLIKLLQAAEESVRLSASNSLIKIGQPAVKDLILALRDQNWHWRQNPSQVLANIGEPAIAYLIAALSYSDLRTKATDILVEIGEPAIRPLIRALRNQDASVRYHAVEALGRIGDGTAVEPLTLLLADNDIDICRRVFVALGKIGDNRAIETLISALQNEDYRHDAENALKKFGPQAVPPLLEVLKDRDSELRYHALKVLEKIGDKKIIKPLTDLMTDNNPDVRYKALKILGEIDDERIIEPFILALKDHDVKVRYLAIEMLGELGDKKAFEPIMAALKDKNRDVCAQAITALGKLKDKRAVKPLILALSDDYLDHYATDALINIGKPAVNALILSLEDGNEKVCANAAEALGEIGDKRAIEPLIRTVATNNDKTEVWKAATTALFSGRMGGPDDPLIDQINAVLEKEPRIMISVESNHAEEIVYIRTKNIINTIGYKVTKEIPDMRIDITATFTPSAETYVAGKREVSATLGGGVRGRIIISDFEDTISKYFSGYIRPPQSRLSDSYYKRNSNDYDPNYNHLCSNIFDSSDYETVFAGNLLEFCIYKKLIKLDTKIE